MLTAIHLVFPENDKFLYVTDSFIRMLTNLLGICGRSSLRA